MTRAGTPEARPKFNLPQGSLGEVGEFYEPGWGRAAAGNVRENVGPQRYPKAMNSVFGTLSPGRVNPRLELR